MPAQKRTQTQAEVHAATPSRSKLPWAKEPVPEPTSSSKTKRSRTTSKPTTEQSKEDKAIQAAKLAVELLAAQQAEELQKDEVDVEAENDLAEELCPYEVRVERALNEWTEDAGCAASRLSSSCYSPTNESKQANLTFSLLAEALQAEGVFSARALANLFRWILVHSSDKQGDIQAVLTCLLQRTVNQKVLHTPLQCAISHAFGFKESASRSVPSSELATLAQNGRQKQRVLGQTRPILVSEVAAVIAENPALRQGAKAASTLETELTRLLGRSKAAGQEAWHLVKLLQAEVAVTPRQLLRALSCAQLLERGTVVDGQARARAMVKSEDILFRAYSEVAGDASRFVPAVLTHTLEELTSSSLAAPGTQIHPMRGQAAETLNEALDRLGEDSPLWAEWLMDGDRVQIHISQDLNQLAIFSADCGLCLDRKDEVAVCFEGGIVPGFHDIVLEAVLVRQRKKTDNQEHEAQQEEAAAESSSAVVVVVFDLLMSQGVPLMRSSLRERRSKLQDIIKEGPMLRLANGREIKVQEGIAEFKAELDKAMGAFYLADSSEKAISKSSGLVLKCLDGPKAEYTSGVLADSWQIVQKPTYTGKEAEERLFACLNDEERASLVGSEHFHFAVISARRTGTPEGVRDLLIVENQFKAAGVTPRWYVDEASLQSYRDLKLDAVVGGKLLPARNLALEDAARLGKVCVQVSDDIARWDFYKGEGKKKTLAEGNAAAKRADRYKVSPVAAARFMLAMMRASPGDAKPQLGGVYPLRNMGQCFLGSETGRKHFILGDFFVVDKSPCRFDESMSLKEDYDFTCSHLKEHGSVLRVNRMIIQAKHETNAGGACTIRDAQGVREQQNIAILQRKWPGVFSKHPKRQNQVVLRWESLRTETNPDNEA